MNGLIYLSKGGLIYPNSIVVRKKHYHLPINISENGFFVNNKPPRGKPRGIFKGEFILPQSRWAGFPLRYNKLLGIKPQKR
jgi:hypothetical protein